MKFDIFLNDNDYFEFNKFHVLRSPYGGKIIKKARLLLTLIFAIGIFLILFIGGFDLGSFLSTIPLFIILALFQVFYTKFVVLSLKVTLNQLKKKGKMAYSPHSTLEFKEDGLVETTDTEISEKKYSAIENICVIKDKYVIIYTNNLAGYIIPMTSFPSREQFDCTMDLLKGLDKEIIYYD